MIFELCKIIGIKTLGDLQRFKKECMGGETNLEMALTKYLFNLGLGFRIKEETKNGI